MLALGIDPGTAICGFGLVEMMCLPIRIYCRNCV